MLTLNTHFYSLPCSLQNNLQMIKRMYKSHSLYDHGARSTVTTVIIFSNYSTLTWHSNGRHLSNFVLTLLAILQNQIIELLPFSIQIRTCVWDGGKGEGALAHTLMELWQMQTKFRPYNPKVPGYGWKNKTNINVLAPELFFFFNFSTTCI